MKATRFGALPAAAWLALAGLLVGSPADGQDGKKLSGEKILRRADGDHKAKDESGIIDMVLISKNRRQRRSLEMLFMQGKGDDDKHRLKFLSPPTVRNLALLTLEASGRSDDQWVYNPSFKKPKKIAASKRTNRFAQTDLTFEDLRTEDFARFSYKRLKDGAVGKTACYVVQALPKKGTTSGYSKRILYVEKARFLILKVEFYDKHKRHQKTLTSRDFKQVNGLWRPGKAMMADHLRGTKTVWRFTKRTINKGLKSGTFTVKSLARG